MATPHPEPLLKPKPEEEKEEDGTKKNNYRVQLLCNVTVTEIEWVTETTSDKLETTTTTDTIHFPPPAPEIDPR